MKKLQVLFDKETAVFLFCVGFRDSEQPTKSRERLSQDSVQSTRSRKRSNRDSVQPTRSRKQSNRDSVPPTRSRKQSNCDNEQLSLAQSQLLNRTQPI